MLDESAARSQCRADRHLPLDPLYGFERSVPAPLELAGDKTICRIDSIDKMRSSIVLGATSSTRTATTSPPRSLLSIARLNNARSRLHPFICTVLRPNVARPQRRLGADEFALFHGERRAGLSATGA